MRKMLAFFVACVFLLSGFGIIGLSEGESEVISISFSHLVAQEKDDGLWLDLEGSDFVFMKEHHYVVPAYIKTFTYPMGTVIEDVTVTPTDITHMVLDRGLSVAPEPRIMASHVQQVDSTQSIDPSAVDVWYDFAVGTGLYRGERKVILKVMAFPVQYVPENNIVKWAQEMEISIQYTSSDSQSYTGFDDEYDLLVLGPTGFRDALDELVEHKCSSDVASKFVSLDDVYTGVYFPVQGRDDQEKIKYFIKNVVEQWNVTSVLLVGGDSLLPTRQAHVNAMDWDDGSFVSDLYYADIYNETGAFSSWDTNDNDVFAEYGGSGSDDEVDLLPDVNLGRLACTNADEVTACVDKIITYETNKAYTEEWFANIIGIGGDTHMGDADGIDEGEHVNDVIFEVMDGFSPIRLYASNGALSGLLPSGRDNINNNIRVGCGFLNFIGHGATWGYGTHPHMDPDTWLPTPDGYYRTSDVSGLDNNDRLPIVMTSGCDVGKFYEDDQCYSWAFVANPHGGGIASFGASAVSYGGGGTDASETWIGGMIVNMYDAFRSQQTTTLGSMWSTALVEYVKPGITNIDHKIVESWQMFGDPSLRIAEQSHAPLKPGSPTGPTTGNIREEYTYTAVTTDPDSDQLYYRFDWGDGTYSEWLGPVNSGEAAEGHHTWTEKNTDLQLRVAAKDIHGVISQWSDPLVVSMPKSTAKPWGMSVIRSFEKHPFLRQLFWQLLQQ